MYCAEYKQNSLQRDSGNIYKDAMSGNAKKLPCVTKAAITLSNGSGQGYGFIGPPKVIILSQENIF